MKNLKATAAALYLDCPNCDAGIVDPTTGSYMIHPDSDIIIKGQATCLDCGQTFKLPKVARLL